MDSWLKIANLLSKDPVLYMIIISVLSWIVAWIFYPKNYHWVCWGDKICHGFRVFFTVFFLILPFLIGILEVLTMT